MKHRPELGDQKRQELEHLFDEDLAQLSQWINIDLSCRIFKHVAKVSMPNWSSDVPTPKKSLDETGP
jgi:hypothetical protein